MIHGSGSTVTCRWRRQIASQLSNAACIQASDGLSSSCSAVCALEASTAQARRVPHTLTKRDAVLTAAKATAALWVRSRRVVNIFADDFSATVVTSLPGLLFAALLVSQSSAPKSESTGRGDYT